MLKTKIAFFRVLKEQFNPSWENKLCTTILGFYFTDVRTGLIPLKRAFRDYNSPFCIRSAVMGFLNPP